MEKKVRSKLSLLICTNIVSIGSLVTGCLIKKYYTNESSAEIFLNDLKTMADITKYQGFVSVKA